MLSFRCPICFDDVMGASCVKLDCSHVFCTSCFTTHCRSLAQEGAPEGIRCPEPSCRLQVIAMERDKVPRISVSSIHPTPLPPLVRWRLIQINIDNEALGSDISSDFCPLSCAHSSWSIYLLNGSLTIYLLSCVGSSPCNPRSFDKGMSGFGGLGGGYRNISLWFSSM